MCSISLRVAAGSGELLSRTIDSGVAHSSNVLLALSNIYRHKYVKQCHCDIIITENQSSSVMEFTVFCRIIFNCAKMIIRLLKLELDTPETTKSVK